MKKRSGIAAIILSLSLAGSAQASPWAWFGSLITVNAFQFISGSILPWANAYMTFRNGQKIDGVRQRVDALGTQIEGVDTKVDNLSVKVTKFEGTVARGLADLGGKVLGLQAVLVRTEKKIDVVDTRLAAFQGQYATDMQGLHQRFDAAAIQASDIESKRLADAKKAALVHEEIRSNLATVNEKLDGFTHLSEETMGRMTRMEALLQTIAAKLPGQEQGKRA